MIKPMDRRRIIVNGRVQGVGFRPFVYRLATALRLAGSMQNTAAGVAIEIEGDLESLEDFLQRLNTDLPAPASIQSLQQKSIAIRESRQFEILPSELTNQQVSQSGNQTVQPLSPTTQILPDLSTCSNCLQDIFSPQNRRYRYPFTNCTHCGPRFSIIQGLPYDRDRTIMAKFEMCLACYEEYSNP